MEIRTIPTMHQFLFQIDQEKCIGCGRCLSRCPTEAVRLNQARVEGQEKKTKKAQVHAEACVSCSMCMLECPEGAVFMVPREQPLHFDMDLSDLDQTQVEDLCRKARLDPEESICNCTLVKAKEAAAAVLKGAKSPGEITIMTGIRSSGCLIHCIVPMQRLLKAHGIELDSPYQIETSLWTIPDEITREYPEFRIDEDKERFKEGIIEDTMNKIFLGESE